MAEQSLNYDLIISSFSGSSSIPIKYLEKHVNEISFDEIYLSAKQWFKTRFSRQLKSEPSEYEISGSERDLIGSLCTFDIEFRGIVGIGLVVEHNDQRGQIKHICYTQRALEEKSDPVISLKYQKLEAFCDNIHNLSDAKDLAQSFTKLSDPFLFNLRGGEYRGVFERYLIMYSSRLDENDQIVSKLDGRKLD